MIVKINGKYHVRSESGKNLGGPYDTEGEARSRLAQVEHFKHAKDHREPDADERGGKSDRDADEQGMGGGAAQPRGGKRGYGTGGTPGMGM